MERTTAGTRRRLSREAWLSKALDNLSRQGNASLRIDRLAEDLGVTSGSFYWHFKDRQAFVADLVEYWVEWSTGQVVDRLEKESGGPRARLSVLAQTVLEGDLGRYDVTMRSWAAQDPSVAETVRAVDAQRRSVVRSLFQGLGFTGDNLTVRTNAFQTLMTFPSRLTAGPSAEEQLRTLPVLLRLLTQADDS